MLSEARFEHYLTDYSFQRFPRVNYQFFSYLNHYFLVILLCFLLISLDSSLSSLSSSSLITLNLQVLYIAFVSLWKFFAVFSDCFVTAKVFKWILLSRVPKIGSVTGNRKSFSGNERKDVKPWNFFTAKQKQYTVFYPNLPLKLPIYHSLHACHLIFKSYN